MCQKGTRAVALLAALSSVLLTASCAMMTRKSTQRIPVTSYPSGATVSVDGQSLGTTPVGLRLSRRRTSHVIRIESPGYKPLEIRVVRKAWGGALIGNLLLGLVPGTIPATVYSLAHDGQGFEGIWILSAAGFGAMFTLFDNISGAASNFEPKELNVALTKADGTCLIDTLFIDPDALRNIKWIRVRGD